MRQPAPEPDARREIGLKIAYYRGQRGLGQEKLAGLVGVTREALRRFEIGERTPKSDTLMRLSIALGVSVEALLPEDYRERFGGPFEWAWPLDRGQAVERDAGREAVLSSQPSKRARSSASSKRGKGEAGHLNVAQIGSDLVTRVATPIIHPSCTCDCEETFACPAASKIAA